MINCELLAPAGSPQSLKSAVLSGADAVYLGGSLFNARASADNFSDTDIVEAIDFCHLHKVKVYITINILISDKEFSELDRFIRLIYEAGADAVIVQDIGVAMYIKSIAPALRLHASTQMTVYDTEGAVFLKNAGFDRVVLARELSSEKIREITENCGIETEIFVHGAMCVCYSGQCLMSSMIGGRSGNRGKCAQPCRLKYRIGDNNGYLMSLKDMCLIRHLKEIESFGVVSLKIEGRMKGPDYVGTVVSIYRKYLDSGNTVSDEDYKLLESIFYRGGFSDGYYNSDKGRKMFCHEKPDNPYLKQTHIPKTESRYKKTGLTFLFKAHVGQKLSLIATDEYGNSAEHFSNKLLEPAKNAAVSHDKIVNQLTKLGDTVFTLEHAEVDADSNVFIPVSEINSARRYVTNELNNKIIGSYKRYNCGAKPILNNKNRSSKVIELSVSVSDKNQLEEIRKTDCKRIYAPLSLKDNLDGSEIVVLPRISPYDLEKQIANIQNTDVLVTNIGQINIAKRCKKNIHIDFTLNVFNKYSCMFYSDLDVKTVTLSTELTINQIRDITPYADCESVVYGKLPLMITENCMIKTSDICRHGGYMYDRTNERFLIRCMPECRNEIFNSKPIMLSDKISDLEYAGLKYGRLNFVDEKPEKCVEIYNSYKNGIALNIDFTRGKFYKSV